MDLVPSITTLAFLVIGLSILAIVIGVIRDRNGDDASLAGVGIAGIIGAVILLAIAKFGVLPVLALAIVVVGGGFALWYGSVMLRRQSVDNKAARAAENGRLGDALRLYAGRGDRDAVIKLLKERLPKWPVSNVLIEVVGELFDLKSNVAKAKDIGVPEQVTGRLAAEADSVSETLWSRAERITVTAAYKVDSPGLQKAIGSETVKLEALNASIRDARTGLAELTFAGSRSTDAIAQVEIRFRSLANTARALEEEGLG